MDDKSTASSRPSGLPRPASRLPLPRSTSVRNVSSRESLVTSNATTSRLRPSASQSQLGGGGLQRTNTTSSTRSQQLQQPRTVRSKPNLRTGDAATATPTRKQAQPAQVNRAAPRTVQAGPAQRDVPLSPKDEILIKRTPALTRRPSEVFGASPLGQAMQTPAKQRGHGLAASQTTAALPTGADTYSTSTPTASRPPRPSLSDRTIETLASIPSSPALSKRPSLFFDQGSSTPRSGTKSRSRASSQGSRPGSSHTSDGSQRSLSRPQSRPGSGSGPDEGFSSTGPQVYRAPLGTIRGTPSTVRTPQRRGVKTPSSKSMLTQSMRGKTASLPRPLSQARSPSPEKNVVDGPSPSPAPRTLTSKPLKLKPSTGGLRKKAAPQPEPRKVSVASPPKSGLVVPGSGAAAMEDASDETMGVAKIRKSSAALREQIAKAKADAKRAASQPMQEPHKEEEEEAGEEQPVVEDARHRQETPEPVTNFAAEPMVNDGWGFEAVSPDPFNQRRSDVVRSKMLQMRANAARTSGRLNIAALSLKQVPQEIMNMYDFQTVGSSGGSWAESVDLTRFVAADNEFEIIDDDIFPDKTGEELAAEEDGNGNLFGGLDSIDLHGNMLIAVPIGFRQLKCLASLNLSQNRLQNEMLGVIAQITSLRDLKLANNLFYGPLPPSFADLENLEILDLHGNNVSALPPQLERLSRLRIMNLNDNSFESLPLEKLSGLPLTELSVRKNKLSDSLVQDGVVTFPNLQVLDVSSNKLVRLAAPGLTIGLPEVLQLCLSMNRLQELPDVSTWCSLTTLIADGNCIAAFPEGFTSLPKVRHVDFSSNDIRVVPAEIARMDSLAMLRLTGNPLRDKRFATIATDELKEALSIRLEPPPPYQERSIEAVEAEDILVPLATTTTNATTAAAATTKTLAVGSITATSHARNTSREDADGSDLDDFATPPQSPATRSRAQTLSSQTGGVNNSSSSSRSRASTLSKEVWPIKPGGILDRSRTESATLHPVVCSRVAAEHRVREARLHHNLFAAVPESLSFFAETLTALSLSHNQLLGETYMTQPLDLPALRELNLASNHITSLVPLTTHLQAPRLEKLDVSMNRIVGLPAAGASGGGGSGASVVVHLRDAFPSLAVLLAANNHIMELDPEAIRGMRVVEVANNDIAHLAPRLGLLGGAGGLERLDVAGNRFRVPRWSVLERGTDATLRWLRGRVPVADMAAWKEANRELNGSDGGLSDVD